MTLEQRYVSTDLCHFVGRGKSEEEQYDLLVNKILATGWLTHPPHNLTLQRTGSLDLSKPISTDELIKYQVVCFCDIPEADLKLHVSKYSRFGLAFEKKFLIQHGASPVFYIANESPVPISELFSPDDFLKRINEFAAKGTLVDRALYFDTSVRAIIDILAAFDLLSHEEADRYFKGLSVSDFKSRITSLLGLVPTQIGALEKTLKSTPQAQKTLRMFTDFLLNYVFTYFKCFEAHRSFEDEKHYYMEREWRISNNVSFKLSDVQRVFFPQKFAARFRKDLPAYLGQISFPD